jgi:hypothetical protein
VDGSRNNSVFEQVFDYNGLARLGGRSLTSAAGPPATFLITLVQDRQTLNFAVADVRPSWHRLLSGQFGLDGGWLLPAAAAGALVALLSCRGAGRRDPLRAAVVLWGGWWVVLAVFFSVGTYLNSYYIAALAPPAAALFGVGVSRCGRPPWSARVRLAVLATIAVSTGYGLYLLHGATVVPAAIAPTALAVLAIAAVMALLGPRLGGTGRLLIPALAFVSLLVLPASASVSSVIRGLGPFDNPFESYRISGIHGSGAAGAVRVASYMQRTALGERMPPIVLAIDTSAIAAPYILYSGLEVLPIGGYLGGAPVPTLAALRSDIQAGYVQLFYLPLVPASQDPRVRWIEAHCKQIGAGAPGRPVRFATYSCH